MKTFLNLTSGRKSSVASPGRGVVMKDGTDDDDDGGVAKVEKTAAADMIEEEEERGRREMT